MENLQKIAKPLKNLGFYKTSFGQNRCQIYTKKTFHKLSCLLFHEKILSGSYLNYVILKFTIFGFPLKIVYLH